ncbi:hypothetical protein BOTBODRAFT_38386 [Botryobasidium botryosum FD-172 SS1]|uniref:TLC domain-containing protein n=1 Tax=Botryobasidium botryosum (strain FD-172 SS1) TaxID=930990 RepID=A0A067LZX6_BOTB1|nr:hypothetical protein BOTBODRAFT_38386 [Botryobasidium botryosum FD-172 SS1]
MANPPHPYGDHHIQHFPTQSISKLAPLSGLILCIVLVVLFFVRYYVLESFLLRKLYGKKYTDLNDKERRGFLNHHIAGATKLIIFIVALYPFINVAFRTSNLHDRMGPGSHVTMGDMLLICAHMLVAMYIFELIYRTNVSPIGVLHHVGTIIIGQTAIVLTLNLIGESDATIEFLLCTVWGAFDIVAEFLPHISIVLYRLYPESHHFLRRVFLISAITTFLGTIMETSVIFYFFGSLWYRWSLAFKITTPLLHCAFSACQLHGSRVFWKMYQKQGRLIKQEADMEASVRKEGKLEEQLTPPGISNLYKNYNESTVVGSADYLQHDPSTSSTAQLTHPEDAHTKS